MKCLKRCICQVESGDFASGIWPVLEGELSGGWDKCSPDTLHLLLVASVRHQVLPPSLV